MHSGTLVYKRQYITVSSKLKMDFGVYRLAGNPVSSLPVIIGVQAVTREVHRLICPAQDHFIFLTFSLLMIYIYIYDFCPFPDPDVGLSILVCDVEHTAFHFGLCGRKFVLCLFGQCPGLCTICHRALAAHRSCISVSSGRWQGCF